MPKNYDPHDHRCPYCDERKPCPAPQQGSFCIFPSSADITCPECAVAQVAKAGTQD